MNDQDKSREQLISENEELRQRVAILEGLDLERRQAVKAMQEDEQRLRLLLDTVPSGIYECDVQGIILSVSPSAERITGFSREELVGTHLWDHLKLGPEKEALAAHLSHLATAEPFPTSYFLKAMTKSGRSTEIQVNWSYRRNGDGQVLGFLVVIADVTARIEAESALLEREDWYRLLAETVPQPIWRCDASGVIECNRRWYEYTGQTPEEARGCGWMAAVYPGDMPRVTEALFQSAIEGTYQAEYRLRRASDGSYRWHFVQATPLRDKDGNILYWFGCATDIHERKEAHDKLERRVEEETVELATANGNLRQSHEQLRTIYDGMVEGLLITDIETKRVRRVNPAFCRILGYGEEELLTKTIPDLHPPEEATNDLQRFQAAAEGRVSINEDRPVLRKDGSIFYADITGHRILYEGRPCLLALFRDVSERKRTQEALKRQQELEAAKAHARERAIELAEADRRKDEFVAMLAHELRNPLAPIRNGIDVLRLLPPNGDQAKQILDMMEEQAHNLVRLIDDLLDVSRCGRGKLELKRTETTLTKIIANAIQAAHPLVHANRHVLAVTEASESLHVHGDPTRLTQVVTNLLNNAARYTPPGGKILLTTERIGDEVAIRVKDNGIGIASDMLSKVFEMFVQADSSLNRKHGGLGIGLTLVKSLVEMHGGAVEATSDGLGMGSEFTVRLPILQAGNMVPDEASDLSHERRSFPPHKILIVDDVQPIAFIVAALLRSYGQEVRTAGSGLEALALIEQEKPELILSDISMPEMTGHELAQAIRRRPEWDDIRLIAVTGYGQESDRKEAAGAGFNSHIVKPIRKEDIERLLASLAYMR